MKSPPKLQLEGQSRQDLDKEPLSLVSPTNQAKSDSADANLGHKTGDVTGQGGSVSASLGLSSLYLQARSYNRMYISCTSLKNVHEIYLKTAFDVHWYIHLTYNEKNQNVQYDLHCY